MHFLISGDVQINDDQCLQESGVVTLTCTVTSLSGSVEWRINSVLKATCGILNDNTCFYPGGNKDSRHTFTSVVANGEFTFKIDPVSTNTDAGDYECLHGGQSGSTNLAICGKSHSYFLIFMYMQI